jgi:hypothetical protein
MRSLGILELYRLPANRSGRCPTRGSRHCSENFLWLGKVYPYGIGEDEELPIGPLIPSPSDDAVDRAELVNSVFHSDSCPQIICYPRYRSSSFLSLGGRFICCTTLRSAFAMSHRGR